MKNVPQSDMPIEKTPVIGEVARSHTYMLQMNTTIAKIAGTKSHF